MLRIIDDAESKEISYSEEQPPKMTATVVLEIIDTPVLLFQSELT